MKYFQPRARPLPKEDRFVCAVDPQTPDERVVSTGVVRCGLWTGLRLGLGLGLVWVESVKLTGGV